MLYLLLLIPLSVEGIWSSVRVSNATELAFFVGFFVFSTAAGLAIGYVRWRSDVENFYWTMLAVYVGGIAAAMVPCGRCPRRRQSRDVACWATATSVGPGPSRTRTDAATT